ncbi:hypothetical protein [Arthrobacter sp. NPDC056727]|uniref:hypothetical protein n=1 Tax=Arthrobacter sp. NPDC056727 TaxID=3345927 RepID=UPI00366E828A
MKPLRSVPGAKAALIAFVLTVLLGVGVTSAAGLWQQSATATMAVSAATAWPGDTTVLACTVTAANGKAATLTASPATTMTVTAALVTGSTVGAERAVGTFTSGTVTIDPDTTTGVKELLNGGAGNVRFTATFDGPPPFTRQLVVNFSGNGKTTCPTA